MTKAQWFLLVGSLLLSMGLTTSLLKRLPVTSAIIYLAVGLLVGPSVFNLFHINPMKQSAMLEVLTEVAVLISLFSAGVKMPVPVTLARWRIPLALASLSMVVTVALVAAFAYWVLRLPLGAAVLLGAIVAPTDPVLATDVQSRHPGDRDQLRFTLTCEAGMNDGSAFPFVMLGLGLLGLQPLGDQWQHWLLVDVLWATLAGTAIGVAAGTVLARICWKLRGAEGADHALLDDFLGLGLIGAVYGVSVLVDAWGFLAVFFAAVALRQTELKLAAASQIPAPEASGVAEPVQTVSHGSLVFKEHLERLSEMMLILLVGGTLFLDSWTWRGVGLALFLFLVARPLSVFIGLIGIQATWRVRGLIGWFGVRGIGSLYYLMFAVQHGLPAPLAMQLIELTLIVVTLSILVHGISVKPMISRFWRRR